MKFNELVNKTCYCIIYHKLDKRISIAKTTKVNFIEPHQNLSEKYKFLVLTDKVTIYGTTMPRKIMINQNETLELKRNFFRFNKNNVVNRDFLIALDKQALANAIKSLFKTYKLNTKEYKYIITEIKKITVTRVDSI